MASEFRGWVGPFQLRSYLENCTNPAQVWPKEQAGVYLVSLRPWINEPTPSCDPLYVGTNTRKPELFLERIGLLVKDALGFFGAHAGKHSGGQSLYNYCFDESLHPLDLHIGWIQVSCGPCTEIALYNALGPRLNGVRPSCCRAHVASDVSMDGPEL